MSTPVPKVVCPGCRTSHEPETNFCGKCGSDLRSHSASLRAAISSDAAGGAPAGAESGPGSGSPSDSVDPLLGRLIDSRYRVLSRLGHGGMGVVYKVEHQRMGKIAAMKVLHRELVADKEVVKRFRREAEAISKLTHPNTVQTFDFGQADGAMYLVMEYVRGEDLGTILRRDGPIPFRRAAPILIQICGALAEAHELGIVHRDLKPENLLVTRTKDGQDHVKVLDFGLAKLSEREEIADVTGRGTIIGTPYYMSPEQIRGETLDHRSDIYSLGAMMYRILTGEHPFTAQSPVGVLTKHLTDELVPPRTRRPELEIDPRVEDIVMRTMAKRKEERYASVDGLREDLEALWDDVRDALRASGERAGYASGPAQTPLRMPRPQTADPKGERRRLEDQSAVEPRLGRSDFDAYERSLRRRERVRLFVVPALLLLAGAGAFVWFRVYPSWKRGQPQTVEQEPNNDRPNATVIAPGKGVRGKIRERLSESESDRDYYRMNVTGKPGQPVKVAARVSPIRNLDLALIVYDRNGKPLAIADNLGVGEPEAVPNLGVQDDRLYLVVLESRDGAAGRAPTENMTDEYELSVDASPPAEGEELEPNDVDSDATRIGAGAPVRGWLSRPGDVDRYRFTDAAGTYDIEVTGGDVAPVRLRIGDGEARPGRKLRAELPHDAVVGVERADPDKQPGEARRQTAATDTPYTLVIRPAK